MVVSILIRISLINDKHYFMRNISKNNMYKIQTSMTDLS